MSFRALPARHWRSYGDDKLPMGALAALPDSPWRSGSMRLTIWFGGGSEERQGRTTKSGRPVAAQFLAAQPTGP
jgi:hypothetical protein